MKQTPAAILILAATVCGNSAASRQSYDSFTAMIGLAAVALGIWGVISLIQGYQSVVSVSGSARQVQTGPKPTAVGLDRGSHQHLTVSPPQATPYDIEDIPLTPEVSAQLAVVAHQEGKGRMQVVEEVLVRHLPRYTTQRVV